MNFNHAFVKPLDLPRVEINGKRYYQTESGDRFPSVTTMLSAVLPKDGLDAWRDAVGNEEADRATNRGARRGIALHLMCEKYVLNDPTYNRGIMPSIIELFNQVKPVLDKRLGVVYGSEIPLYSRYLRLAGTCDLVAMFDGKISIIDYKTTNWAKDMSMLEGYFIQEAIYSAMFLECYKINAEQLVTISAGESEHEAQVIIEQRDTWLPKAVKLIKQFYEKAS
jgi:genome maintenance exonuclease 1